ncbi:TPA: hypothetical protein N3A33_000230 [Salmonella enterica subsp. salamae serovar 28:r:e,n,z15]|nr:hypothetical protein [Salmonella enterica subsp. salamae serovar 28:r:e,n,z15]
MTTDLIATTTGVTVLPDTSSVLEKQGTASVGYWVKNENSQTRTVIFKPEGTTFQVDSSNSAGWLAG